MATTTSGSITFQQIVNGVAVNAIMHLPKATSLSAIETFAAALAAYTDAAIIAVSFTSEKDIENKPSTGDEALGFKAMLLFHGTTTASQKFAVPAPKENLFETVAGKGVMIKKATGDDIAELYSTLTNDTFEFIRGRLSS